MFLKSSVSLKQEIKYSRIIDFIRILYTVFEVSKKVKTRTEFFKKYNTAYGIALKEKWIDEMFWLVSPQKPKNYWNINNVWNECKKYETLLELRQNCKSCYYAICKFKLNEEVKKFYKNLKKE